MIFLHFGLPLNADLIPRSHQCVTQLPAVASLTVTPAIMLMSTDLSLEDVQPVLTTLRCLRLGTSASDNGLSALAGPTQLCIQK